MANRVTINICGEEYTFIADESGGALNTPSRCKKL